MARRIVLVSYYYPPDPSVGSHRWAALGRYLRRLGYDISVVTTSAYGALPDDGELVSRTADLTASPLLRRLLRRPPLPRGGAPASVTAPIPPLLQSTLVPDPWLASWLPFALRRTRALVRRRGCDCIVTNSPPESTHLIGLLLGRSRPAWIADFEDGWRFEPLRGPWPTRVQDRIDAGLEARVMRSADGITCVTPPMAQDAARRHHVDAAAIPLAWDPELERDVALAQPPALERGRVNILHTGVLTHPERRDPSGLLAALRTLSAEDPATAARIRLVLAGPLTRPERQLLDESGVGDLVTHLGALPRASVLALQRRADVLLLLASGGHASQATGKLFEYLAAARPILALSASNEAARIVRETHTGMIVSPDDPHAIVDALRATVDGRLLSGYRPVHLERYRYPAPAEAFARAIERAIGRSRAG